MIEDQGWKTSEAAQRFKRIADLVIPGRQEMLSVIARLTIEFASDDLEFLDLGSGYSDLSAMILGLCPNAHITLVDYSDEMLRIATERFGSNNSISIVQHDLNDGIPDDCMAVSYDAVISTNALHHVDYDKRIDLCSQIYHALKDGGLFINGDRFKEENQDIDEWIFDDWISWIVKRVKDGPEPEISFEEMKRRQLKNEVKFQDKPVTIWEIEKEMREAGFKKVDCLYKNRIIAIIAAQK